MYCSDNGEEAMISVRDLVKIYRLYPGSGSRVKELLHPLRKKYHTDFHALNGISLDVAPGECLGIIGPNGSGKSTLLKIISGVLTPSSGDVAVNGRISALLELGAGFNPDFTGKENVFFQGLLSGISRREMEKRLDAILEFADIGPFADQPVHTYSSGMFVRLAFAVAINVDPEILIIDEALAVGDAFFQAKCIKRIRRMREQGVTLLFVSHDPAAVLALCDRAVLLDQGEVVTVGDPETVYNVYNARLGKRKDIVRIQETSMESKQVISGSGEASVQALSLLWNGQLAESVPVSADVILRVKVAVLRDIPDLVFGFMIKDRMGQPVFGTNTYYSDQVVRNTVAGQSYVFSVSLKLNIGPGAYTVSTALVSGPNHLENNYEWKDLAFHFSVISPGEQKFVGKILLENSIEVTVN